MLQIRPKGGGTPYAPDRDIVNVFRAIARKACYELDKDNWSDLFQGYLEYTNTTNNQLTEGAFCLAKFIANVLKPENADPRKSLEDLGFYNLPAPARLAFFAKIGEVVTAYYHHSARNAFMENEELKDRNELLEACESLLNKKE